MLYRRGKPVMMQNKTLCGLRSKIKSSIKDIEALSVSLAFENKKNKMVSENLQVERIDTCFKNEVLNPDEFQKNSISFDFFDHWTRLFDTNIDVKICDLSDITKDITVVNAIYGEGSYLKPHYHDRVEKIYVLDGSYYDEITDKTFYSGDVQIVPAFILHSQKTDYCRATITWKPAYPSKKIVNYGDINEQPKI